MPSPLPYLRHLRTPRHRRLRRHKYLLRQFIYHRRRLLHTPYQHALPHCPLRTHRGFHTESAIFRHTQFINDPHVSLDIPTFAYPPTPARAPKPCLSHPQTISHPRSLLKTETVACTSPTFLAKYHCFCRTYIVSCALTPFITKKHRRFEHPNRFNHRTRLSHSVTRTAHNHQPTVPDPVNPPQNHITFTQ